LVNISIYVEGIASIIVPNVFTPNGDGVNDYFILTTEGITEVNARIFNRWGEKIYEWYGINGIWDGRAYPSGKKVPSGQYFYVISAVDINGIAIEKQGNLSLLRGESGIIE